MMMLTRSSRQHLMTSGVTPLFCNLTVAPLEQLRKSVQKTFSKTGVEKAATWESHGEAGLGGTPRALQLVLACLGGGWGVGWGWLHPLPRAGQWDDVAFEPVRFPLCLVLHKTRNTQSAMPQDFSRLLLYLSWAFSFPSWAISPSRLSASFVTFHASCPSTLFSFDMLDQNGTYD